MTLIVVDQFRTTADDYATTTNEHTGECEIIKWTKISKMKTPIKHEWGETFTTIAFAGDAQTFMEFKIALDLVESDEDNPVTEADLIRLASEIKNPQHTVVVIPCPSAVLVLTMGNGKPVELEYRQGAVHAFGSDYDPQFGEEENRAWFSIFIDAKRAGRLKGDDLHFSAHDSDEIKSDTLLPARKAKKFRTRSPFRRR